MKILKVVFLIAVFLYSVPNTCYAQEIGKIYYYCQEDENETVIDYHFNSSYNTTEKAFLILDQLFKNTENHTTSTPYETKLIDCSFYQGYLTINLSKEALNCAGNYNQSFFIKQIINTVYSIDEIRGIIVLVEYENSNLSEGVDFSYYDRF